MRHPVTRKPFAHQIADELSEIGYTTRFEFFRVSRFGAPQTRRRFIFVAYKGDTLRHFRFPPPERETPIRDFLFDLGQGGGDGLPNHNPTWGFDSFVHTENGGAFNTGSIAVPVRLSRTASDGHPVRSFDQPFPAVDTATVWGWAFPDDWVFCGGNKRELQLQVGNAVPVVFAKKIAMQVRIALEVADGRRFPEKRPGEQMTLFDT